MKEFSKYTVYPIQFPIALLYRLTSSKNNSREIVLQKIHEIFTRTHYDHNNPPPKVVQGYTFNIFYQKESKQKLFRALSFLMIQSQDSTQLPTLACGTETEKENILNKSNNQIL